MAMDTAVGKAFPMAFEIKSLQRGQRTVWHVYPGYRLDRGWIQALTSGGRPVSRALGIRAAGKKYLPMLRPELPSEFAKLSSEQEVLRFVGNYGLLGFSQASITTRSAEPHAEETNEPIDWILGHARTVRFILEVHDALLKPTALRKIIKRELVPVPANPKTRVEGFTMLTFAERGLREPRQVRAEEYGYKPRAANFSDFARIVIADILTLNLEGVHRHVCPTLDSVWRADSLIDVIYWLLADAVSSRTVKRCRFCGQFFTAATTSKRLYCPPPLNSAGDGPCAQNDRARRYRVKNRKPKGGQR
jgi:hypothetical protein